MTTMIAASSSFFVQEMKQTKYQIFQLIQNLGFFGWNPPSITLKKKPKYKYLSSIQCPQEILQHINLKAIPPHMRPIQEIIRTLPMEFLNNQQNHHHHHLQQNKTNTQQEQQQVFNYFPYGRNDIACLYVAKKVKEKNNKNEKCIYVYTNPVSKLKKKKERKNEEHAKTQK